MGFKNHLRATFITLAVAGIGYYLTLPALNIHNAALLFDIAFLAVVYRLSLSFGAIKALLGGKSAPSRPVKTRFADFERSTKVTGIIIAVCVLIGIVGAISGWQLLRAKDYRQLLEVKEGDFTQDVEEISYDQIPTLDYDSATKLGTRKMGELSDMVSQFTVLDDYTQINYKGRPTRVTPLGYADVFKWINNVSSGIPAYISIDMVSQEVTVHRLESGMKYTTADHFNRYLERYLRFRYPTYIFDNPNFEIDENGTPIWVCPRIVYRVGLYGGRDIDGVVLVNAVTGDHQFYASADIPSWVDRVYNSEMIIEQYDYFGTLQKGYWNSLFGQKDCKQTTDGYNYIAVGDDVYMYTGVTSVAADESNVGFILANQRTKQTKFYAIAGAEEFSAMSSAEGEVQNLKYQATFPLLLNIGGEPTYFVALKDAAGLVKMYAMVNVRQYQIVGKGQTLGECEKNYTAQLGSETTSQPSESTEQITGVIDEIRTAVVGGNSVYYFTVSGKTYRRSVEQQEDIVILKVGDTVKITFTPAQKAILYAADIEKAQ